MEVAAVMEDMIEEVALFLIGDVGNASSIEARYKYWKQQQIRNGDHSAQHGQGSGHGPYQHH